MEERTGGADGVGGGHGGEGLGPSGGVAFEEIAEGIEAGFGFIDGDWGAADFFPCVRLDPVAVEFAEESAGLSGLAIAPFESGAAVGDG